MYSFALTVLIFCAFCARSSRATRLVCLGIINPAQIRFRNAARLVTANGSAVKHVQPFVHFCSPLFYAMLTGRDYELLLLYSHFIPFTNSIFIHISYENCIITTKKEVDASCIDFLKFYIIELYLSTCRPSKR